MKYAAWYDKKIANYSLSYMQNTPLNFNDFFIPDGTRLKHNRAIMQELLFATNLRKNAPRLEPIFYFLLYK